MMNRKLLMNFCLCLLVGMMLPGLANSPAAPAKPHIVFVSGDHEYGSEETMPLLAAELEKQYGFRCTVLKSFPDENAEENIPGLDALDQADVAVFYLRWRRLPKEQLEYIRRYLASGKPVLAFRTTTHAFNYPKDHELAAWNRFAADYLGAPPGWGNGHFHYGHTSSTDVRVNEATAQHPILRGVDKSFHVPSWLYHVVPNYPPKDAEALLIGTAINSEKKDAVENPVAWTWKNKAGARVLMTTLGHPQDFSVAAFQRFVINSIHWAAGKSVPKNWRGKISMDVKYHGLRKK